MNSDVLDDLILRIYENAFDDAGWSRTVTHIGRNVLSSSLGFDHNMMANGIRPIIASVDIDLDVRRQALEHFNTPETNAGMAAIMQASIGKPVRLESIASKDKLDRDPSFRWFFRPQKFDKGMLITINRSPDSISFFSLFRTKSADDYTGEDEALLAKLAPHVAAALRLRDQLCAAAGMSAIREHKVRHGKATTLTMVVDAACRLVDAEIAATLLLDRARGLALRGRTLISTSKQPRCDTESLHRYIAAADGETPPFVIDCDSATALKLSVLPIPAGMIAHAPPGSKALTVVVVNLASPSDLTGFAARFGLTSAEQRFLEHLVDAATATDAARAAGLSRNTAKVHLSRIFDKTGCESQGQLMFLVGRYT